MGGPGPIRLAAEIRGALSSALAGLSVSLGYGTIEAINVGPPMTVNVYLNNSAGGAGATVTPNLPIWAGYTPAIGDGVFILIGQGGLRTSYIVMGTLAGGGTGSLGLPIGAIVAFAATFSSPMWLLCNGGTFSATTYPALNAFLGGNTLPNLVNTLPMGAGSLVALGAAAGAATHTLTTGEMPGHTHTGPSHTHTDSGHSHGHSHAPGSGSGFILGSSGGAVTLTGGGTSLPQASTTDTDSTTGNASLNNAGTGATGNAGSGSSHSILNPVTGVAYYVKAL
jgi:microcystin-dependent protein